MGNREDLLAAAKKCLLEKGYDRTTVRDIAQAAKVSMAAIGYHYGSREALLNEALFRTLDDWGDSVGRAVAPDPTVPATPTAQFESRLARLFESFQENRQVWLASVEAFLQAQRSPELRAQMAAGQEEGRRGLAAMTTGIPEEDVPESAVRTVGTAEMAIISGLMFQSMMAEGAVPTPGEVLTGLRKLLGVEED